MVVAPWPEPRAFDLCIGDKIIATCDLPARATRVAFAGLPAGRKRLTLWMAPNGHVVVKRLEIDGRAEYARVIDHRPVWVTYGSSITQCSGARSAARTWAAQVARAAKLNLVNPGMSGECVVDAMVARTIRDIPADCISLELGPNVYGYNALNERSFRAAILAFVRIIREKHPRIPIVLMSAIYYPVGETKKNKAGFTMRRMREEVRAAAEIFRARGDRNVHYVSGLEVLDARQAGRLPDKCHPDQRGYDIITRNFLRAVVDRHFR